MTTYWDNHVAPTIEAHDKRFAVEHPDWEQRHGTHLTKDDLRAAEEALALVGDRSPEGDPQVCAFLRALNLASVCGHPDEDHPLCCGGCPDNHLPDCREPRAVFCVYCQDKGVCERCGAGRGHTTTSATNHTQEPRP